VNFSAAVSFSTEQNPVNWKGLKARNFYLEFDLPKTPIYRIVNRKPGAERREILVFSFSTLGRR
jgi:hypothetical protein